MGADQYHARVWSRTRKGGWAIAQSPIPGTTVTVKKEPNCLTKKHTRTKKATIKNSTAAVHWIAETVRSEATALAHGQIIKR